MVYRKQPGKCRNYERKTRIISIISDNISRSERNVFSQRSPREINALRTWREIFSLCPWRETSWQLPSEKTDVTAFMVWFIENYPESAGHSEVSFE